MIHEEWITNVLANQPGLTRAQLEKTRDVMNQGFLDALVWGFEPLISTLTLPDPNDRHVLAAAIESHADVIVTANLKDFPPAALMPHGIAAAHPDDFVDNLFDLNEDEAFAAAAGMRGRLRAPSMTPKQFIESIEKAGLPQTAVRLRRGITSL